MPDTIEHINTELAQLEPKIQESRDLIDNFQQEKKDIRDELGPKIASSSGLKQRNFQNVLAVNLQRLDNAIRINSQEVLQPLVNRKTFLQLRRDELITEQKRQDEMERLREIELKESTPTMIVSSTGTMEPEIKPSTPSRQTQEKSFIERNLGKIALLGAGILLLS